MSEQSARRPARQRAASEQMPVASTPVEDAFSAPPEPTADTHDPGGWLAIGMMLLMIAVIAFVALTAWRAA